jgi:hypothetical protein
MDRNPINTGAKRQIQLSVVIRKLRPSAEVGANAPASDTSKPVLAASKAHPQN